MLSEKACMVGGAGCWPLKQERICIYARAYAMYMMYMVYMVYVYACINMYISAMSAHMPGILHFVFLCVMLYALCLCENEWYHGVLQASSL